MKGSARYSWDKVTGAERGGIVQGRRLDRDLTLRPRGKGVEPVAVTPGDHHVRPGACELGGDEPAGVTGGSVDRDRPLLPGGERHRGQDTVPR